MKYLTIILVAVIIALAGVIIFSPKQSAPLSGGSGGITFGETGATSTNATLTGAVSTILGVNPHRSFFQISRCELDSTSTVYIGFNSGFATSTGIPLYPMGSSTQTSFRMGWPNVYIGNVYAISYPSSSVRVCVIQGLGL